ncbi:hypothetical protein [Nocardia carnea]|uniref:Uncharacterized protein n=1 Tax=Nocardia carnea TaxID=37328 RepID=A0ABW7TXJ6_9NOCA|nr:hypothetical protein [Nocardia carnea]
MRAASKVRTAVAGSPLPRISVRGYRLLRVERPGSTRDQLISR